MCCVWQITHTLMISSLTICYTNITKRQPIRTFDSLFYTSLTHNPDLASNWTKNINIFYYDKLIIPICQCHHWILIVVSLTNRTIKSYNSLLPRGILHAKDNIPLCKILNFLNTENRRLYQKKFLSPSTNRLLRVYPCKHHPQTAGYSSFTMQMQS